MVTVKVRVKASRPVIVPFLARDAGVAGVIVLSAAGGM